MASDAAAPDSPLDRAVRKAYWRLIPIIFLCYVVAYIDRVNVGFAKLTMQEHLAPNGFTESIFALGMGPFFFFGYLLLEIPGTLLVERWSARKWICRIMVSWGFIAALTAFVRTPWQFFGVRFLLGLAEAGFFPGVIVYLTHWFPRRDRTRALSWFLIGTPIAQMIAPPLSEMFMGIGEGGRPAILGMVGWQWVFVVWGIPAVIMGAVVLLTLTDRPSQAKWLTQDEREALESKLASEKAAQKEQSGHMTILQALSHPKIVALAAAYFFVVTGNYGVEMYMSSILKDWYGLDVKKVAYLIVIPATGSLLGQLFIGWNSDRTRERRWHATLPIVMGSIALFFAPASEGNVVLTVALFTLAMTGLKAYLPAFWALPSLLMTESAAAASIGMINSFGNLGGGVGPYAMGWFKEATKEYSYGLWFLATSMIISALIIASLGIGRRAKTTSSPAGVPEGAVPEGV